MSAQKVRLMTAGEFVAESLEEEAAKMPDGHKEQAEILRNAAKIYRESGSKKNVHVTEDDGKPDFIRPDPASH